MQSRPHDNPDKRVEDNIMFDDYECSSSEGAVSFCETNTKIICHFGVTLDVGGGDVAKALTKLQKPVFKPPEEPGEGSPRYQSEKFKWELEFKRCLEKEKAFIENKKKFTRKTGNDARTNF